jgi:hypothetical protein
MPSPIPQPEVQETAAALNAQRARASDTTAASAARRHIANLAVLATVLIVMFWRVFFLGETLVDVNTLNNQLPWGYNAPASDYPYNRRDLTDMYVTRDYFVVQSYRDGEMPLWNPYTMAGHPIYADGVTRTLSPFLLFYKFVDVPLGYSVARITELLLAAVFMYIFLIGIGVSPRGALMGSLVLELSAHSMLHLTGLGWWGGLMWLPLIFLFVDRAWSRRSHTQAAIAGLLLGAQFFCGYIPNQIYYVGGIAFCYLFFAIKAPARTSRIAEYVRAISMTATTIAVGLGVAATQWVPTLELLRQSNRRIVGAELGYIFLPPWYGATLIFPNLFGEAYDATALRLFTGLGVSHDHILYIGIAGLALAGFSLFWMRSRPLSPSPPLPLSPSPLLQVSLFAWLGIFSLLVMMAAPLYVPVTRFIPILQVIRVAVRAGVLFLLAASVLVGFGADLLLSVEYSLVAKFSKLVRRTLLATVALVVLAVLSFMVLRATGFAAAVTEHGKIAFVRRAAAVLSEQFLPPKLSILIPLIFLAVVAASVQLFCSNRLNRETLFGILAGLLIVDLFWCGSQFNQTFDRSRVFPTTEITGTLKSLPPGRVLVVPSDLETNRRVSQESDKIIAPPNTLLAYGIPTVTGKNQQFPKWYRELASLVEPQPNLSHVVFDRSRSPIFDLLNARYVLTRASFNVLEDYSLIKQAEGVSLFENPHAMPRAFFAAQLTIVNGAPASLEAMRSPSFDPRNQVVLEVDDQDQASQLWGLRPDSEASATGSAEIIEDRRNRVAIRTRNDNGGLLVLGDNFYNGWRADVDGAPTPIYRADHSMRSVAVPAGEHVVTFVFLPGTLKVSAYVSVSALLFVAIGLALSYFKPNRQRLSQE